MPRLTSWRWWAPVLVAAAIVAAEVPGDVPWAGGNRWYQQSRGHAGSVLDAKRQLAQRIEAIVAHNYVARMAGTGRAVSARGRLRVTALPPLTRADAEEWASAAEGDVRALFQGRSGIGRVDLVVASFEVMRGDSLLQAAFGTGVSYAAVPGGIAEPCLTVRLHDEESLRALRTRSPSGVLAGCALVAGFGAPGRVVRDWLAAARHEGWDRLDYAHNWVGPSAVDTITASDAAWDREAVACATENSDVCSRGLSRAATAPFARWLIQAYGSEAFASFWRSNEDFGGAVRSAFGVPLDSAVRRFGREHYVVQSAGILRPSAPVKAASYLVLCLAVALILGRRRSVDR